MKQLTATGSTITSVSQEHIKLDRQIKKVLACKPILAIILKESVEECKEMSCDEIEKCIEGKVVVESIPLFPTEVISGGSQEDYLLGEGMTRYDIRTHLKLPSYKEPELSKILLDIEAQKDDTPGYSIATRGLFYCCRMISSQLNTEFTVNSADKKKYQNIKKVYSIWICTDVPAKRKNSIERYSLHKEMILGNSDDDNRYDLLSAIIVNVGKPCDNDIVDSRMLNVLSILIDSKMGAMKKISLLRDKYDVPVTKEIEKEVWDMCTYTTSISAQARTEGLEEGRREGRREGESKMAALVECLIKANRSDDIEKAVIDETTRDKFYKEFGIID